MARKLLFSFYFCLTLIIFQVSTASAEDIVLRGADTALSDFPVDVLQRPPSGLDQAAYDEWLKTRPALVLDGATLRLGRPGAAVSLSIQASRVELRHAQIITYGAELHINALQIASDGGTIRAFDSAASLPPETRNGVPGQTGYGGGRVILRGALSRDSRLDVQLDGQDGGQGGPGRTGQQGAPGAPGDHAADHAFDCAHGGGAGSRGEKGQRGEAGASGGNGGDGGTLILQGKIALQVSQISVSYRPGAPGAGGLGGSGGPGGPGGPGGGGSTYCRGGPPGPSGPPGDFGPPGGPGTPGRPGQIIATSE